MKNNYEIVQYSNRHRKSCIELLNKTYPAEDNEKAFVWRYERECVNKPIIVLALNDDEVVCFNAWIPWEFSFENKTYIGYQSGKSATSINHRRRGLWEKTMKKGEEMCREHNVDFVFGFPGSMSYNTSVKVGYISIATFNYRMKLLSPFSSKDVCKGGRELDEKTIRGALEGPYIVDKYKIVPFIDYDYFKWRYIDNQKQYKFFFYEEANNKALFVVREITYQKYFLRVKEILLLDCQFSSFNTQFIEHSLQYLSRSFASNAHYIRSYFSPTSERGRALNKYFHITRKSRYEIMTYIPISRDLNYLPFLNCNNWDVFPHLRDST